MDPDETKVRDYLGKRGLLAERFTKHDQRKGKTPDFRVLQNGELVFFCEVKSSPPDGWLDEQLQNVAPGEIAGGERNDPAFNRFSADIHEAVKQFDAVNADQQFPNVLALSNHDGMCDFSDLLSVITGNLYASDGSVYPIYRQFSDGRIKEEKNRIHLFIWLDDHEKSQLFFNQTNETHHARLCTLFGVDPNTIRLVGS